MTAFEIYYSVEEVTQMAKAQLYLTSDHPCRHVDRTESLLAGIKRLTGSRCWCSLAE